MRGLIAYRWLRGGFVTTWRPSFLWGEVYRGVEVGRLWVGWTNPYYKRRGW